MRTLLLALLCLAPLSARAASLQVTTDPPGAAVQLDGVAVGTSPVTVRDVAAGMHLLKITADGYEPRLESVQVAADDELQISAPLNPKPKLVQPAPPPPRPTPAPRPPPPPVTPPAAAMPSAPAVAPAPAARQPNAPLPVSQLPTAWGTQKKSCSLWVDTTPVGATVEVVGMPGPGKASPTVFSGFAPGTVTLRVSAPGYETQKVQVELKSDARTHVRLEPGM